MNDRTSGTCKVVFFEKSKLHVLSIQFLKCKSLNFEDVFLFNNGL